jgi:hypothetical protein
MGPNLRFHYAWAPVTYVVEMVTTRLNLVKTSATG